MVGILEDYFPIGKVTFQWQVVTSGGYVGFYPIYFLGLVLLVVFTDSTIPWDENHLLQETIWGTIFFFFFQYLKVNQCLIGGLGWWFGILGIPIS